MELLHGRFSRTALFASDANAIESKVHSALLWRQAFLELCKTVLSAVSHVHSTAETPDALQVRIAAILGLAEATEVSGIASSILFRWLRSAGSSYRFRS